MTMTNATILKMLLDDCLSPVQAAAAIAEGGGGGGDDVEVSKIDRRMDGQTDSR